MNELRRRLEKNECAQEAVGKTYMCSGGGW